MRTLNHGPLSRAPILLAVVIATSTAAWALPIPVIPVVDVERAVQTAAMLRDVIATTAKVNAALDHLRNAATSLGGGNLVQDILIGQRYLTADIRAISYSMETVSAQYQAVFPDAEAARNVSAADAAELRNNWDQEIQQSSLAASRAQASLSRLDANTKSAADILERSMATTGGTNDQGSELAKLQALVQMLGVINSDLTTLSTTIATTERLNTAVAAAESSDEAVEAAKAERMLRDYAAPEPIPTVTAFPGEGDSR